MRDRYDVAVVGAGPAGLAARDLVVHRPASACVLFDEQQNPGGQIYRGVIEFAIRPQCRARRRLLARRSLVRDALTSGAHYVADATVWGLLRPERDRGLDRRCTRQIRAARIILATGAIERPFPIPGWTLPGVMTAGAAQILLKSSALVPQARTVLAGCGPLLWLLAWQYLNAGVRLDVILDTTSPANWRRGITARRSICGLALPGEGLAPHARRPPRGARRDRNRRHCRPRAATRIEAITYRTARGDLAAASRRYAAAASRRGAQCESGDVGQCRRIAGAIRNCAGCRASTAMARPRRRIWPSPATAPASPERRRPKRAAAWRRLPPFAP